MFRRAIDGISPFWLEPWRFAAPAWRAAYGAPGHAPDRYAERLLYGGWAARFDLSQQWHPPADSRWLDLLDIEPQALDRVVAALGYVALVRADPSVQALWATSMRGVGAWALKYREVNSMKTRLRTRIGLDEAGRPDRMMPHGCGVDVLRAMARNDWPDIEPRIAMITEPDREPLLLVDRVDVGRCLSVCGAIVRYLTDDRSAGGGR